MIDLKNFIRSVPDFPKPGIDFKDITPLLGDGKAFSYCINELYLKIVQSISGSIDKVVAPESRGFILASALSVKLNAGFVPIRKPGKLPYKTYSQTYDLEYATNELFIHQDALKKDERVLVVDDLLATGGTIKACSSLVEKEGAKVIGACFVIELEELQGRSKINIDPTISLIKF